MRPCSVSLIPYVRVVLEPRFGGIRFGVSEAIFELVGSLFYFLKETFNGVPISACLVSKSEAVLVACSFQPRSRIDEKHGVITVIFLGNLPQERSVNAVVIVGYSRLWCSVFDSGLTAVYNQ
jgi:hypothetical protein